MLALVIVASAVLVPVNTVNAQESAALSISPRKNYTIEPGKEINDTLLIRNIDREKPLNLSLKMVDFTFNNDGGTPKLMLDENAPQTSWSLKSFMEVPRTATIDPGQSENVNIQVKIPANQGAGSYYSAIVYSSAASDGGNVGLNASGVTLVFVTIPGTVNEKLTIQKIGTYNPEAKNRDGSSGKYNLFNLNMPDRISYTIKNEGNVAESPVGSITLKNVFGQEKTINDINPNKSLALIGQTRRFDACIMLAKEQVDFNGNRQEATTCAEAGLWPGIYSVTLNGYYGQNGNNTQEIIGKGYFVYTPWWFIVLLIVIVAFVGYHVWRLVRFIRFKQAGGKKFVARSRK